MFANFADAVLSLLEQPLNLLGVNGFRKPEEEGEPDGDMSQRLVSWLNNHRWCCIISKESGRVNQI